MLSMRLIRLIEDHATSLTTHPPTAARISDAQKEIARILTEKDEYVITTFEFDQVKARLRSIMFPRKAQPGPDKPTLRTKITIRPAKGRFPMVRMTIVPH